MERNKKKNMRNLISEQNELRKLIELLDTLVTHELQPFE